MENTQALNDLLDAKRRQPYGVIAWLLVQMHQYTIKLSDFQLSYSVRLQMGVLPDALSKITVGSMDLLRMNKLSICSNYIELMLVDTDL